MTFRFREESPSTELDYRVQKAKRGTPVTDIAEGRRLRKCRRTATSNNSHSGNGTSKTMVTRQSPPINSEKNGRQHGRASEQHTEAAGELAHPLKKTKLDAEASDESSFFKCIAPDCSKKFKHISGLRYHQSHAHKKQSYVWMPKPETAANSDSAAQDKCKNIKKSDDASAKLSNGAPLEPVGQDLLDQKVGIVGATVGCDLPEPESVVMKQGSETTTVKCEVNLPEEVTKMSDVHEQILTSSDASIPSPQWPSVSVITSLAVATESAASLVLDSFAELPQHSAIEDLKRMAETGKTSETSQSKSPVVTTDFHTAVRNVAEMANSDLKTNSPAGKTVSDLTDKTKNRPIEIEAEVPNRADVSSSPATDIFHKPILRTPEVGKHRTVHQSSEKSSTSARMENGQPTAILRPQNIGLKLLPTGDCNNEDKSPAYSDISDANDGAFSESEMRLRKADKELKRAHKADKLPIRKYEDFQSSGLPPSSGFKHSPFPMPATALPSSQTTASSDSLGRKPAERVAKPRDGESDQSRKPLGVMPSSKTGAIGTKPPAATTPVSDRQRTEKSNQASDFNMEILQAQENGRLWMEMIQRSSMTAANMMPYGYAVDPLAHMQLMTSNREYREHYERWYMGQQCYRQLLQAESDRCSAGDKPVDMSAKSVSSVATGSSDSVPFYAKSKTNLKLPSRPGGSGVEDHHTSSEKHRDSVGPTAAQNCPSDFGKGVIYNHHEKSTSSRDKLLVPKQEPVGRQRVSEKDEKLVDLMHAQSNVNKVKGKPMDGVSFGVSSPNTVSKPKAPGLVTNSSMSAHQASQMQDYPKTSLAQMRYDTNFAPFAAYGNPSYIDSTPPTGSGSTPSTSVSMASRYQDLNSKYPSLGSHEKSIPGHSPSVAPARKSGQLATPLSAKELSPTEKSESRRQPTDSFDFAANEGSVHDKPSTSSSSGHGSPLTLRHLHTHHHTHLVGPYPIYGPYNGINGMYLHPEQ